MKGCVLRFGKLAFFIVFCALCSGCTPVFWNDLGELFSPEKEPRDKVISEGYQQIELNHSSAAEVLAVMYLPDYELLSQSRSVIAVSGQKKDGYKNWLRMAAFDEDSLTVTRKYLVIVDEKPKSLFVEPWASLRFDCEMVLDKGVLTEPYSNENARRIEILKQVLNTERADIGQVGLDNKIADTCGMLVGQAMETVLVRLKASPVLAGRLDEDGGLWFEHPSLDQGRIKVDFGDEVVTVDLKAGSIVKTRVELTEKGVKLKKKGR